MSNNEKLQGVEPAVGDREKKIPAVVLEGENRGYEWPLRFGEKRYPEWEFQREGNLDYGIESYELGV